MHLNSLTPMQISGTPWSFLNFGQPPPDIDQARCESEQMLLWRCRRMPPEPPLSYHLDLAERPEGVSATAFELKASKTAWVSNPRSRRCCAISSVAGGHFLSTIGSSLSRFNLRSGHTLSPSRPGSGENRASLPGSSFHFRLISIGSATSYVCYSKLSETEKQPASCSAKRLKNALAWLRWIAVRRETRLIVVRL